MNQQQVESAIRSGLDVLGPESDVPIPAKHNEGIFFLRLLLTMIAQGKLGISQVPSAEQDDQMSQGAPAPSTPDPSRKAAKKKA